jgi:hypothetical protein
MRHPRHTPGSRTLLAAACALAVAVGGASTAAAEFSEVVPGVTYERLARPGQIIHVVRVIQGPRISIRPVLTGGSPSQRGRLTDAMRARLGDGAVVGVNGDYFNLDHAYPSGLLVVGGELVNEPEPTRSALLFPATGQLATAKVALAGTWQAVDPSVPTQPRTFAGVNRPSERADETLIYTSRYGTLTPVGDRVDALIALDPPGVVGINTPVTGTVQSVSPGGGSGIGPGKLVISGAGVGGDEVLADLSTPEGVPKRRVTLTFGIAGIPPDVTDAIGGGPTLVQDGVAITAVNEGFTTGQIGLRTSRTAIGQTTDGTILLVTAEGPVQSSRGMTMAEQAALLVSLGARTAVGMDGGGSALMSIRDRLVTPWASERAISDAVVVSYTGVQLSAPDALISPNGDGVAERTRTTARAPTSGMVRITLARPNGRAVKMLYAGPLGPAGRKITLAQSTLRAKDGRYRVIARFVPGDGSGPTAQSQNVTVDRTLGFLRLRKVGRAPATKLRIGFRLTKSARATIVVRDAKGGPVKLLVRNRLIRAGNRAVTYDLKRARKPLKPGVYTVSVSVRTKQGEPTLSGRVRVTAPKRPAAPGA